MKDERLHSGRPVAAPGPGVACVDGAGKNEQRKAIRPKCGTASNERRQPRSVCAGPDSDTGSLNAGLCEPPGDSEPIHVHARARGVEFIHVRSCHSSTYEVYVQGYSYNQLQRVTVTRTGRERQRERERVKVHWLGVARY